MKKKVKKIRRILLGVGQLMVDPMECTYALVDNIHNVLRRYCQTRRFEKYHGNKVRLIAEIIEGE